MWERAELPLPFMTVPHKSVRQVWEQLATPCSVNQTTPSCPSNADVSSSTASFLYNKLGHERGRVFAVTLLEHEVVVLDPSLFACFVFKEATHELKVKITNLFIDYKGCEEAGLLLFLVYFLLCVWCFVGNTFSFIKENNATYYTFAFFGLIFKDVYM